METDETTEQYPYTELVIDLERLDNDQIEILTDSLHRLGIHYYEG